MDNMNFTKDPFISLISGVDDDKLEDMNLEETIDRVIRKKVACGKDESDECVEKKVAKAKKRLASFIAELGDRDNGGFNPFVPLMLMFIGGSGGLLTDGLRGIFTDKDGNEMPEEVFKNELMPLSGRASNMGTVIRDIEALTEEDVCSRFVPKIAYDLFVCKDELLELLRGRKEQLDAELKEIIERHTKKDGENLDNPK